ncbi:DUF339-domain-containing protein [Ceraceosorus guamensis]|uniref:Succinate dehydrogenase assembly factor 2, mitochondrial n=1 Tax=Ceraceosorus guamensis TaxID=1522189 RepID=A0A316W6Z1_9BASI|nr:DUF339-domain-containing protein [Ceraceosorus guamensis]PWN43405.1 DUF339-domain-containing protein [Ceraceosorus guamensis]
MVLRRIAQQGLCSFRHSQCSSSNSRLLRCVAASPAARASFSSPLGSPRKGLSTTRTLLKDDVGTGVDPGYTSPSPSSHIKEEEMKASSDSDSSTPAPSHESDPFPLPFDPRLEGMNLSSASQSSGLKGAHSWEGAPPDVGEAVDVEQKQDETPVPIRLPGRGPEDEDRERRIARLIYQARKRGTLETDLLLSTFAQQHLKNMPDIEVLEFDILLDEPDWDLFYWLTERKPVPERWRASFETEGRLGWRLRKHTKNENKEVRRMPSL